MEAVTDWEALWRKGGFNRWPSEELVRWASTLPEGSKVLEVGCGAGANLRALESFGHEAWGVDIATEAVNASERLPGSSHATVITPVSATELPFEDESFDAVCDVQCFQHLAQDELPLAYREAARVLKPGGRFLEVALYAGQEHFPELFFNGCAGKEPWLEDAGLRVVDDGDGEVTRRHHGRYYAYWVLECEKA